MRTIAGTVGALTLLLALPVAPDGAPAAKAARRVHPAAHGRPHGHAQGRSKRTVAHAAIIGGAPAENNTFPQLAFIVDKSGGSTYSCTGTVVAPNVVLTAGHCAEKAETGQVEQPGGYAVVTGNVDWSASPEQISRVSRVVVYPGYNRASASGDAALLILSTPTTAPAIALASYPADSVRLQAGTLAVIAGWGDTFPGQSTPTQRLRWANTVVQPRDYCEISAPPFYASGEICAIYPPTDRTGPCFGDSGGPLITPAASGGGEIQLGVISHGSMECSTERPSVFTRVDLISSWVNEWIAAVSPAPAVGPPPQPAPPPAPTPQASISPAPLAAPPAWPNTPGYYVTRPSRTRRVVIHVSGDGAHVVGLRIKMPVTCRHGFARSLDVSLLSYAANLPITNHIARETLEVEAGRESRAGQIGMFLGFTASGNLEGRLRVHVPFRSRRVGLCAGTLSFTAKI